MKETKGADYFPLRRGLVWEYRRSGADPAGHETFRVLSVTEEGGRRTARCRRTVVENGRSRDFEVLVTADPGGVYSDGVKEFPLPPEVGARWRAEDVEFEIETLEASVEVPLGRFQDCLKVVYRIAGGDGGSGWRLFAPGVGLVREERSSETDPVELSLLRFDGSGD